MFKELEQKGRMKRYKKHLKAYFKLDMDQGGELKDIVNLITSFFKNAYEEDSQALDVHEILLEEKIDILEPFESKGYSTIMITFYITVLIAIFNAYKNPNILVYSCFGMGIIFLYYFIFDIRMFYTNKLDRSFYNLCLAILKKVKENSL